MSFTDGKQHVATLANCNAPWGGAAAGFRFRCALCGHKFVPGDKWRFVMTNSIPNVYGGNPLVCEACDGTNEEVYAKWNAMHEAWKKIKFKYWHFIHEDR